MIKIRMIKVLLVLSCLFLAVFAQAEQTYDEQGDLIRPNSERYAGSLNNIGPAVQGVVSLVVINDTNYKLDDNTLYRNEKGDLASLTSFAVGMQIEFYAIANLVTKMRVSSIAVEDDDSGNEDESLIKQPESEELRLEDGVWKN